MTPLFDAYVIVDWSAANTRKTGADSIWIAVLDRGAAVALENHATRALAVGALKTWLADLLARGRRVLAGFDFAFGYPAGTAARLGLAGQPWRATWDFLVAGLIDHESNRSNRFAVAAEMNRRLSGRAFPFWGCPAAAEGPLLSARKSPDPAPDHVERRLCERRVGGAQPVWKLAGIGSVGSQALTGIPRVAALRDDPDLAPVTRVWPFETGLAAPPAEARLVLAEVYPSLVEPATDLDPALPKDARQVTALARWFSKLDEQGALGAEFTAASGRAPGARAAIEREEGWILGARAATKRAWLADPDEIYARSFARVRRATKLDAVAAELRPVAVRLVHATGDPTIIKTLAASPGAVAAAVAALARGATILVDAEMVAAGITRRFLSPATNILCRLNDAAVPGLATAGATTRSAAAVDLWGEDLDGAVVAIGNAPTALFRLLELLEDGAPAPACVLGFPVGFVGAAESKAALMAQDRVPWIALGGRRGGSALAAAAVNVLALTAGDKA